MNQQSGFLKTIIIIVIALIILGYFGVNITNIINSPMVQTNLAWLWNGILWIWSIISVPFIWLWNLFKTLLNAGLGTTF
jgi:hypothetical protein